VRVNLSPRHFLNSRPQSATRGPELAFIATDTWATPEGMNMKREFALAGIALVISILLSSPTFA
jgi:hypothetical protein